MPQVIQHPTLGPLSFPDGMSDSDIVSAIKVAETPQQEAPSRIQSLGVAAENIPAGALDFLGGRGTQRLSLGSQNLLKAIPQPQEVAEMGKSMLTTGGPTAVAQRVGFAFNPYVGAVATMLGSVLGRYLEGKRTGNPATGGQLAESAILASALPAQALKLLDKAALSQEMQKMVAATVFGRAAQKAVDTGEYISKEEAVASAAEAIAFFKMGNKLSMGTSQRELEGIKNRSKGFIKTMSAGIDEGLMPDPSISNPRGLNKGLVGFAGQSEAQALFRRNNQIRGDAIAREELGLGLDAPLTTDVMKQRRADFSRPYEEIAKINDEAKATLNLLNERRFEARSAWDRFAASKGDVAIKKEAAALSESAISLEDKLEKIVVSSGNKALLDEFKANRVKLAKWHIFDISLNANGGRGYNGAGLDLDIIGKINDPMYGAFTGKLKTLADFASINENVIKNTVVSNPIADKKQSRAMLFGASGATLGHYMIPNENVFGTQIPGWMIGAGLASIAQTGISSAQKTAQLALATPSYQRAFARPEFRTNVPEMLPSLLMSGGPAANLPAPSR